MNHVTQSGNVLTNNITTTAPNGSITTEVRRDAVRGSKTSFSGTINRSDGVVNTFTGQTTVRGPLTITNHSYHESNGVSYHTHEVKTAHGPNNASVTSTTNWSGGSLQVDKSTVATTRLQPPLVGAEG